MKTYIVTITEVGGLTHEFTFNVDEHLAPSVVNDGPDTFTATFGEIDDSRGFACNAWPVRARQPGGRVHLKIEGETNAERVMVRL